MSAVKCHCGQMSQYLGVVKSLQSNVSWSDDSVVKQDANLFSNLIFQKLITDQQGVYFEDYRFLNNIILLINVYLGSDAFPKLFFHC